MEPSARKIITMNDGYILLKRENEMSKMGGLVMADSPGNAVKGIIVETSQPEKFKLGNTAYCANGVAVKINGAEFMVIKFEHIFFTLD